MDQQFSEIAYHKGQTSSNEPQKRKKYERKKNVLKAPKLTQDFVETAYPESNSEINAELIHYTYKLEYELSSTKRKLKHQRRKFRHMIHSLAKYFDSKGITSGMIDDYVKLIGADNTDSDSESDFNRLFTTHKFQVIEDLNTQSHPIVSLKQPTSSVTKTISAPIEVNQTPSSIVQEIVTPSLPQNPEKKRGRPSQKDKGEKEKKEPKEDDGADKEKKKRKNKKKEEEAKS